MWHSRTPQHNTNGVNEMYNVNAGMATAAAGGLAYTGVSHVLPLVYSASGLIALGAALMGNSIIRRRKEARKAGK